MTRTRLGFSYQVSRKDSWQATQQEATLHLSEETSQIVSHDHLITDSQAHSKAADSSEMELKASSELWR